MAGDAGRAARPADASAGCHKIWCVGRSLIAGDTDQAEQLATEALQIGTDGGEPDATVFYGGQLLYVVWQRGTLVDLIPFIDQLDADMADVPHGMVSCGAGHGPR